MANNMSQKGRILLTNKYSDDMHEYIKKILPSGFNFTMLDALTKDDILKKCKDVEYLLVSGRLVVDKEVIDECKNLKMVYRIGSGVDNIDVEYLNKKGIDVLTSKGINSNSVAEYTILLILSSIRNLIDHHLSVRDGEWKKYDYVIYSNELRGKVVGIIGMGDIGKRVSRLLEPFGVKIIYYSINKLGKKLEKKLGLKYDTIENVIKSCDILTLHCSLNNGNKNMIGFDEISKMKKGSILINTSRGDVIDEDSLIYFIRNRHIKYVALDVYKNEPKINKDIISLGNVLTTPHVAGLTEESFKKSIRKFFRKIKNG